MFHSWLDSKQANPKLLNKLTEPVVCYRGYGDKQTSDKPYNSQMNNRALFD